MVDDERVLVDATDVHRALERVWCERLEPGAPAQTYTPHLTGERRATAARWD